MTLAVEVVGISTLAEQDSIVHNQHNSIYKHENWCEIRSYKLFDLAWVTL